MRLSLCPYRNIGFRLTQMQGSRKLHYRVGIKEIINMEKSLLMQDEWGSNHGYEAMLDFQISWLLQVAKGHKNEKLLSIARYVMCCSIS